MSPIDGTPDVLHETRTRLRLHVAEDTHLTAAALRIGALAGVVSVRVNEKLRCIVVVHDGHAKTRDEVLVRLRKAPADTPVWRRDASRRPTVPAASLVPPVLAAAVPVLPAAWRNGAALGVIALRVAAQAPKLRVDAPAVLLDATSLAALAVTGQALAVSASVVLRDVGERLSLRLVRQADHLLDRLVPNEADRYQALRGPGEASGWSWWPLRALRAGDRVRLLPGDVVPVDGSIADGAATLVAPAHQEALRAVKPGDHVVAGERLREGTVELRAEADAASSRLQRLRAHVQHAIVARDPAGRLTPSVERLLSLPLTAAALVFGLTGDTARAAAMLQADPQQGLDLAIPLAREAALYAIARHGLLANGLESIERLAVAHTLVLQDAGVLATGRWTIEAVHVESGGDPQRVRQWLATLADTPIEALDAAGVPDLLVRQWIRHGAVLRVDEGELHVASAARLRRVWGLAATDVPASPAGAPLRRVLFVVAAARIVATVVLTSPLRAGALEHLQRLATLGFDRIAVFTEGDGREPGDAPDAVAMPAFTGAVAVPDDRALRGDWLAEATSDGTPLVMVHTVLRDLLPPGSLSLTPTDADAGAHGVLLGDPMASLVTARALARRVHRRLRVHQGAASATNAALMMASALRWVPPVATALVHHGFALLLLLDTLRMEALGGPRPEAPRAPPRRSVRRRDERVTQPEPRSETA